MTGTERPATTDWEDRLAVVWSRLDDLPEAEFLGRIDAVVAELPEGSGMSAFERAAAQDSTGHPDRAVPLYREALRRGLEGERRRRATIQLASSLRNLGHFDESIELLFAERERTSDALDDAVIAVLALALVDAGRSREAASFAIGALARHLPRYQRSMANYAKALRTD